MAEPEELGADNAAEGPTSGSNGVGYLTADCPALAQLNITGTQFPCQNLGQVCDSFELDLAPRVCVSENLHGLSDGRAWVGHVHGMRQQGPQGLLCSALVRKGEVMELGRSAGCHASRMLCSCHECTAVSTCCQHMRPCWLNILTANSTSTSFDMLAT